MAAVVPGAPHSAAAIPPDVATQLRRGLARTAVFVAGFVGFVAVGGQLVG